jgi:hypothetical protein
VSAQVSADQPAGKELVVGGQIGYSRELYKTKTIEALGELGYDLSYEAYPGDTTPDSVTVHSLRVFTGYSQKLSGATSVSTSVEALFNLNEEKAPTPDGSNKVSAFDDTRVNWKTGVTTSLYKALSLSVSYLVKYDHAPAPRAPFKLPYAMGFRPFAETLDTVAELALVMNFL